METIFAVTMVLICLQEPDSNYLALFRSKGSGGERGRKCHEKKLWSGHFKREQHKRANFVS
jgi:hypothetical protein